MTTLVRPATIADAPRLSQLGANTFRETFEGQNTPDDMASYLAEAFTADRQAAEIGDTSGVVLLAERPDAPEAEKLVGYAHMVSGPAPPAVQGLAPMELKRLYVIRIVAWEGRRPSAHGRCSRRRARPWCEDPLARCVGTEPAGSGVLWQVRFQPAWASTRLCSAPTRKPTGRWPVHSERPGSSSNP